MSRGLALAFLASLSILASAPAFSQANDHRWAPDNSGFSNGLVVSPGQAPGSSGTSTETTSGCGSACDPKPPEPPKTGAWKYASNGHVENTCTAGASVFEFALGCFDGDSPVDASQCPAASKPPYQTCKWWQKMGGQGNCPTGYPIIGFTQTYEYASVGFMYDWKGTCYRNEITPYR